MSNVECRMPNVEVRPEAGAKVESLKPEVRSPFRDSNRENAKRQQPQAHAGDAHRNIGTPIFIPA
jgi:hypothetical protein